jgi:flagellar hook-length control protein FliK
MLKGGENVSNINLNTSSGAVALVSPDNSVSNSTDSSNEGNFNNVLASKTNGNSAANASSQSNAVSQSNDNNNVQSNTSVNDTSGEDYTAELQKVKSQIDKLEDGSGNLDDGTTAALLLSLQQILNAILNNANTSTNVSTSASANASVSALTNASASALTNASASALTNALASALTNASASSLTNTSTSASTNVSNNNGISGNSGSIDLNSQLTQIENILQEISKDLVSSGKGSNGQISSDSFSQNGLQQLNLSDDLTQITKDISSLVQTQQNQTSSNNISGNVNSNLETKLNDIVECLNLTNQVLNSSNLSSSTMKNSDNSLFGKLRSVISSTINELKNTSTSTSTSVSDSTENDPSYVATDVYTSNAAMNNADLSSSTSDKNSSSKDNEFLNNLISSNGNNGNSDNNYSKVTNVINQFINSNPSSSKPVENQLPETQIRSANFAEDVITNVKYMQNNNIKDMTVTIAPKELGQVLINVSSENGVMKASITATNKEAYNLLNSNLGEINKNLSSQAVGLDNVEVNIYNGDTTFFKDGSNSNADTNQQQQKNKISNVFGIENSDDSELGDVTNMYEDNNVNALA